MLGAELYDWLKFGHTLMAIIWVGGAIAIQVIAMRIVGQNDPVKRAGFAGDVEFVGTRIFTPGR